MAKKLRISLLIQKIKSGYQSPLNFVEAHISNTQEARAFALLSEEGIAKGIRRIIAVTTDSAFNAMELACLLDQEISEASKEEGTTLEKKVASLRNCVDSTTVPAAMKADLRIRISQLQDQVRKVQKRIAQENIQNATSAALKMAEIAAFDGRAFCITQIDVSLDATAVREAVLKVMEQKGIPVMIFNTDKSTNKAMAYAGAPEKEDKSKDLEVSEWLTEALTPLKGKCSRGKGGLAQGQGTDVSHMKEAMDAASTCAALKLK